ncbi:hypothetical protein PMAYCL1PPCAC_21987, partial [Pristionchus mayeri]
MTMTPMTHRLVLAICLCFLAFSEARVTFDASEVLDQSDINENNTAPFECPNGCRVYTPTSATLKIVDEEWTVVISFADLNARAIDNPLELEPGNYSVANDALGDPPEFILYVVQKGADNYNAKVYTSAQTISTNDRYITVLTDLPGMRLNGIGGDIKDYKPAVYAAGADSENKCKPVFQSRSFDNAQRTSVAILGPIASIDFGTDKYTHFVTFNYDYLTGPTNELGSSTVVVTPGYTGCGNDKVFTKEYDNGFKIDTEYKLSSDKEIALTFTADYSIAADTPPVEITINDDVIRLEDSGSTERDFVATEMWVFFDWTRAADDKKSNFAIQIDNLLKSGTGLGLAHIVVIAVFVVR